jgi:dTDP-glucose 4,6-dehydratase/UDP-glucose 4-epimerase
VPDLKTTFIPWPEIDKKIETGDYISDISLLEKEAGWKPRVSFEEGIKKTIAFYGKESN